MNSKVFITLLFLIFNIWYLVFIYYIFYKELKELYQEKEEQEKTIELTRCENYKLKEYIEKLESLLYNESKEDDHGNKRNH